MTERKGVLSSRGTALTLLGPEITVGQKAPDFHVRTGFSPDATVTLAASRGKLRIFNVVPSLDTRVCEAQTIRFNEEAARLGDHVEIITVSMDLPPAQGRFCSQQLHGSAKVKMVSDYAERSFGLNYGILIKEWQILGRGIFVIDKDDIVQYVEYCSEFGELPDFDKALAAVKRSA